MGEGHTPAGTRPEKGMQAEPGGPSGKRGTHQTLHGLRFGWAGFTNTQRGVPFSKNYH